MYLSIGVTGHRDLLDEEKPALESRVRAFFEELEQRFPGLDLQLLTPLAAGGDQLAAKIAVERHIALVAVLPMALDEYEKDFTAPAELKEFRRLLATAQRVIHLPAAAGADEHSIAANAAARDRQYAQLGLFVSNHCQILLALWDGKPAVTVGGTAQVVRYHLTAVMEGFEDQQSSANLLADNENDLVYHIVCSRNRSHGIPATGMAAGSCYWITSQSGRTGNEEMPPEYAIMFERLQEFETDRVRLDTEHDGDKGLLAGVPAGLELPVGAHFTEQLFAVADRLAVHFQKRVNRGLFGIYGLAVLMGLVFIVYTEYTVPQYVLWIFLALFLSGVALHVTGDRHQWHRKYLDYRALAEALRVQFYWNLAGVVESRSVAFAYENFLQKQDVELGWIRHVMRAASLQRARGAEPDPAWVPWVIEQWVGEAGAGGGQLAYYSHKEAQNSVKLHRTEFLGAACLWAGIGIAVILASAGHFLSARQQQVLLVLMGLLPLTAGIRDAISHKRAEKELIKQYRFMARIFANARKLLDGSPSIEFQRRVLKALGEAALEEGAEWILMHRARPLEHQGLSG